MEWPNKTIKVNGEWVQVPYTQDEVDALQNPRIAEIEQELQDIKLWFLENDWKAHKIALGEWERTDSRCIAYLEERALKRNLQDSLNQELIDLNV